MKPVSSEIILYKKQPFKGKLAYCKKTQPLKILKNPNNLLCSALSLHTYTDIAYTRSTKSKAEVALWTTVSNYWEVCVVNIYVPWWLSSSKSDDANQQM